MKKALVTGGCGFIGSNLTKELVKRGWQVDVVDDMSNGHLTMLNDCLMILFSPTFWSIMCLLPLLPLGSRPLLPTGRAWGSLGKRK